MSDTLTADAPAVAPPTGPTFSPEAVASMREAWVAQRLDPAAFDVAAGLTPAEPGAPPPAATGETGGEPSDAPPLVQTSTWTPDQVRQMAQDLINAGVAPERVAEALERDGISADFEEDTRTEDERTYDRLYPPTTADSYKPSYVGHLPADTPAATLQEYDAAAKGWAASMQLAPEIGASVIEQTLDIGAAYSRASEAERAEWKISQAQAFEKISGGPEAANARLADVRDMLARAPKAFTDAMYANGSLHSAAVVNLLACEAARLKLRG